MQRFNVFFMIHKGLRALLYDVSMELQHTDFAHASAHSPALERLESLLEIFDAHAGHEDNHIFNMLDACNPALQAEMEQEHVTDLALSEDLRKLSADFRSATDAGEKKALGNRICYTYYEYMAFNLKHLNKEETVVNESLWQHYADEDIVGANMRMVGSLSPEEVRRNAVWMMRGCSNGDIINWLGVVKKQAPEPVLQQLLGIAGDELPAPRFDAVQQAIMELA